MLYLILFVIFSVAASRHHNRIPSLRVVGGRDALPDEYTFVVRIELLDTITFDNGSISRQLTQICTGSMITPIWVLTCSHCIQEDVKDFRIRYGDMSDISNVKRTRNAVKLMVNPGYIGANEDQNDIGLIMVETVPVDKLARLSMIEYTSLIGLPVKYAGYGRQIFDESNLTRPLQVGDAGVIPCDKELANSLPNIPSPAICVAAKCNDLFHHVYYGDSGGPLFYDGHIVGVTFGGVINKAIRRVTYQFFTPISPYMDWIQSVIGN